ncbi:MAG: anhydro-N-acetylmuramic acid kinase [Mariprofundaceae bacterium]
MPSSTAPNYFIGVMSGTSCDGIDVALVQSDNNRLIHFSEHAMPTELRESVLRMAEPSFNEIDQLGSLDRALGLCFSEAILSHLQQVKIDRSRLLAIGSHGQTIRHRPNIHAAYPFTLQIGCAATIAEQTGITVISDFRKRDIAAGGEGAPLVPFAHQALFQHAQASTAILNIGGIANITMLNQQGSIQGFDTGPGNMIMDQLMLQFSDGRHAYDQHGALAEAGTICSQLLSKLMEHPFLSKQPPKSTGREEFGKSYTDIILAWPNISDADRMATACDFTVQSIVKSLQFLHSTPKHWLICGGGSFNQHLMRELRQNLNPATVRTSSEYNIPAEAVESISFALLAQQTLQGKHNTLAEVTGARHNVCGGQITPGENWPSVIHWLDQQ